MKTNHNKMRHLVLCIVLNSFLSAIATTTTGQKDYQYVKPLSDPTMTATIKSDEQLNLSTTMIKMRPAASSLSDLIPVPLLSASPTSPDRSDLTSATQPSTTTVHEVSTTTTTNTTTSPTSISTEEEDIDPKAEDLCIHEAGEGGLAAFVINQSWSLEPCNHTCRCVFRSEPKNPMLDIRINPTLNMKPKSEQTEIRCSLPAHCTVAARILANPNCLNPRLELPPSLLAQPDRCACPNVVCNLPVVRATTTTMAPTTTTLATTTTSAATTPVTTTTTTTQPTTTTETESQPVLPQTRTATKLSKQTTSISPTPLEKLIIQHNSSRDRDNLDTGCKRNPAVDLPVANNDIEEPLEREYPLPMMARLHEPLQQYVVHLLIALSVMTILFTVVLILYLRKSTRIIAPISTQTSAYDDPDFTKLVSYYANKSHVLLVNETIQNYNNDAIMAKQKNLEVDKSSPLMQNNNLHHHINKHQLNNMHKGGRQRLI